jgi:hypothetical protein
VAFASTRDAELAAFVTESGHYQFTCMPFGLMNSPIVFQRLIDKVTHPLRVFTVACRMPFGLCGLLQLLEVLG